MRDQDKTRTVVVSGVGGFLGRHIAAELQMCGYQVIGLGAGATENAPSGRIRAYIQMRLPDPALEDIIRNANPDAFVHCAGRASVRESLLDPETDFEAGPGVTFSVLNTLRQVTPTCKFLFLSSAAVYGDPQPTSLPIAETHPVQAVSPYGWHKYLSENLCREFSAIYELPTASVRIFSAYGPGIRRQVMWDICEQILSKKTLELQGTGEESRDFIHARDVARAITILLECAPMSGESYNLASGRETTIRELAENLRQSLDFDSPLAFTGSLPDGVPRNWRADISKLRHLGFEPKVKLEDGLHSFANWCRAEILGL